MPRAAAALIVIGLWLGLLAASWAMAGASFRTVDHLLGPEARPEFKAKLGPLSTDDRRTILRHVAAESNRWMFRTWTLAEMVLGALLVAASWRIGVPRALALVAVVAVVVQAAGLAPAISQLGRSLDFVPRPLPPADGRRFGLLHAAYMLADLVKAGVLVPAAVIIARRLS
jgi:hypothetical protein